MSSHDRPPEPLSVAERLELAFELAEGGLAMMRQTLKRRHPDEDERGLRERFEAWLAGDERWPDARPWSGRAS